MKQFLDHFATLQQMDAGAWIAGGALLTMFGLFAWAFVKFVQSMIDLYGALADRRAQNREQDNG